MRGLLSGALIVVGMILITGRAIGEDGSCPRVGFTLVESVSSPETRPLKTWDDKVIYVRRDALTNTRDITEAKLINDGDNDATLQFKYTESATRKLHDATTNHPGIHLAFIFNELVLNNVVWQGTYGFDSTGAQISIKHGLVNAKQLMMAIKGCTAAHATLVGG